MKRTIVLWALAALALAPVAAQDSSSDFDAPAASEAPADPSAAAAPAFDWGTLKYSGDQDLAWRWGAYNPATRTGGFLDSTMKAEYKRGDIKAVAGASVRYNEYVPEETALYWSPGQFKFGVGLQEFSWGVADKLNPTDTLNARDYRYDMDAPRLVNPAASVNWYPVSWVSVEAVYEPWKEQSKFPMDFAGSTQAGLKSAGAQLGATLTPGIGTLAKVSSTGAAAVAAGLGSYNPVVTTPANPDYTFDNPVYGGRVNFFLTGLDLSFSYIYDLDSFYTPVVHMSSSAVPNIVLANSLAAGNGTTNIYVPGEVDLVLNRVHRFGLNAKTTVDKYGLWVETAYNKTQASSTDAVDNRHDSIDWTAGMDFNYGPGSNFYVNIQYAGVWVMNYDASTTQAYTGVTPQVTSEAYMETMAYRSMTQTLGDQTEQMLNSLVLRLNWPLENSTVTPSINGVVSVPYSYDSTDETRYVSLFVNPEIDLQPVDGLHLIAGADLSYAWVKDAGSSDVSLDTSVDRIGVYTPQNNIYVKVEYKWNGTLGGH